MIGASIMLIFFGWVLGFIADAGAQNRTHMALNQRYRRLVIAVGLAGWAYYAGAVALIVNVAVEVLP